MGTPGPAPHVTLADAKAVFVERDQPYAPLTATEVADELECTRRTAYRKLEELADRGDLETKKAGARSRVWWRPMDADGSVARGEDRHTARDEDRHTARNEDRHPELEQFGAFVSAVEDYAIFMLDPDGVVVNWNEGAGEIKGYDEEEIVGEHFSTFYTDEDVDDGVPERNLRTATGEGRCEDEGWRVRRDGSRFWANVVITAIHGDDGELRGFTKVTRDLTERRRYERELRRERDQIEEILQAAPIAIAVQDADGETRLANRHARETPVLSEQAIAGDLDLDGEWTVHDADGEAVEPGETPSARVRNTAEPVLDEEMVAESQGGERRWFSVNATPVFGPDGDLDRVVTAGEDVTEIKRRERELEHRKRELETELSEILGRVSDAFYALDDEWRFTHVNDRAEELLQRSREELVGENLWELFPEAADTVARERFHEAMETQEPTSFELYYEPFELWIEANVYPSETGVSVYFHDATERIERERELARSKRRYQTLVENFPNGAVALVDEDLRYTTVGGNPIQEGDLTVDGLEGSPLEEVLSPELADLLVPRYDAAFDGESSTFEDEYGDAVYQFHVVPVRDEDGNVFAAMGTSQDVTDLKERERQLEEQRERYRGLVDVAPVAIAAYDAEGAVMFANAAAVELAGVVAPEELIGEPALDFVHPDDRAESKARMRTVIEDREPVPPRETRFVTADGEQRHTIVTSVPITFDGEPAAQVVLTDVTDRKARERELERYEAIVETVDDGVYTVDDDGRFTMVNEAYTELTGYSREELLGSHVSRVVDEETVESARDYERALADGERDAAKLQANVLTADGGSIPAEATFALLPGDDEEYGRVGVVRDVTERVERERALEESERRYRTLVENFPDGVVAMFDEDLRYTTGGGQLLEETGTDPEEAIGTTIYERYPADIVEEIEPYFRGALAGAASTFEVEYHDRNLLAHTLPVENAADEVYAGMLVVQDVSERTEYRRRLEETVEKLEESNERLEQFAYVASHDLREPLRMISNYLRLLEDRYRDELDEDAREFIDFAVDGAERMGTMIDDLLAYSRVDSRAEPLEPTDSRAVVDRVLDHLELQLDEADAEVVVDELPRIPADDNQLEQVFQNLVSNAIKYRDDDPPRIEIAADERDGEWLFRVSDNGIGIEPRHTDRIFEVFERLHTDEEYPGTGIGLALCRRIVERHGGDVWVDSTPGEGSTFYFTVPKEGA